MAQYVCYNASTGQIVTVGECPDDQVADQAVDGYAVLTGAADPNTDYIVTGIITPRPTNPSEIDTTIVNANGIDVCIISNIPNPSTISFIVPSSADPIDTYVDTDGTLTFSSLETGEYLITIDSFPYLIKTFNITAV